MKPDNFEQRLQRQPLRPVPLEWRTDILAAARTAQPPVHVARLTPHAWLSTLNSQLATLLWPHPKAWAGLAAIWVVIGLLNVSIHEDSTPRLIAKSTPPSPEVLVELRQQQKLFAELVGPREEPDADRSKMYAPHPRGERTGILMG